MIYRALALAERTEMHDETTLQKLGLNKISTKKEIFSTQKEIS
jgi:hypothetical protein